jgi:sec-independent protein translocase protein TatB
MLDIGWSEMLIVGVVALVVVGPKDLPKMFHTIGQFTGKARGMAREFQRAMDVAAKEAGVDGLAKNIRKVNPTRALKDAVGFDDIEKEFRDIGRDVNDVRKSPKAQAMPKANAGKVDITDDDSEAEADELDAQDHDADLAARNAEVSAVEEQRLIRARKIADARQQAAEIRARNDAESSEPAEPAAWRPTPKAKTADTVPKPARKAPKKTKKAAAPATEQPASEPTPPSSASDASTDDES